MYSLDLLIFPFIRPDSSVIVRRLAGEASAVFSSSTCVASVSLFRCLIQVFALACGVKHDSDFLLFQISLFQHRYYKKSIFAPMIWNAASIVCVLHIQIYLDPYLDTLF